MRKITALLLFVLLSLTACSSKPVSSLIITQPTVNIVAELASKVSVKADRSQLIFSNLTEQNLVFHYQLVWYDKNGVTQQAQWHSTPELVQVKLSPKQHLKLRLQAETASSTVYRIFVQQ